MSMIATPSLDSATWWLNASNVLYVGGAAFTVLTAAWVLYEERAVALGKRPKYFLLSEILAAGAAVLCLTGTIGAIHYSNKVSQIKDADLATYKTAATIQIVQAKLDAATAYQLAGEAMSDAGKANKKAEEDSLANTKLKIELGTHEKKSQQTESDLASQNARTAQFVQSVAEHQQSVVSLAQGIPSLTQFQIDAIAEQMKPFAGQKVVIHADLEAHCVRLGRQIETALKKAGMTVDFETPLSMSYLGIELAQKYASPPAPRLPAIGPLYNALLNSGIEAKGVYDPSISDGLTVQLNIGPP